MAFTDIIFKKNDLGYYDFEIENADISQTTGFVSAINITIFNERRALASEVAIPENRRGWWGNAFLGFDEYEMGSKLWLLNQARAGQLTLNNAVDFVKKAFQWFIDDGFLTNITVTAEYNSNGALILNIKLIRSNKVVFSAGYQIWENTITELSNKL